MTKLQKTMVMNFGGDSCDTLVLTKGHGKNYLCDQHESVLHKICVFMNTLDLARFKQACTLTDKLVRPIWILERMLVDNGLSFTLAKCIYRNNVGYVEYILRKQVPHTYIVKGFVYSVYTGRTDMALFLLDHLCVERSNLVGDHKAQARCCIDCGVLHCFVHYICVDCSWQPDIVTTKDLMVMACESNNVTVLDKVVQKYGLICGQNDMMTALLSGSLDVIKYLRHQHGVRVGKRGLNVFTNSYSIFDDKLECLDYVLKNKITKLDWYSALSLAETAMVSSVARDVHAINRIFATHLKMRVLNKILMLYVEHNNDKFVDKLLSASPKIKVQPRLFKLIDEMPGLQKNVRMDALLYNRYMLKHRV